MVLPEGLEPPTLKLEVSCSIQLSYGSVKRRANAVFRVSHVEGDYPLQYVLGAARKRMQQNHLRFLESLYMNERNSLDAFVVNHHLEQRGVFYLVVDCSSYHHYSIYQGRCQPPLKFICNFRQIFNVHWTIVSVFHADAMMEL